MQRYTKSESQKCQRPLNPPILPICLVQVLEDQLFNDHLLRLWRTGAGTEEYMTSEDKDFDVSIIILHSSMIILYDSFIYKMSYYLAQFSHLLEEDGDYALWQDYRAHCNMEPVKDAVDFVIVNNMLHDEFDEFKRAEISIYSYLRINELLKFYLGCNCHLRVYVVKKYGHGYLRLLGESVDELIQWIRNCGRHFLLRDGNYLR